MSDDEQKTVDDGALQYTEAGKLRHENKYLNERIKNLEVFKSNFFSISTELIVAKEKIATLQQQLVFNKVKDRISAESDLLDQNQIKENDDVLEFLRGSFLVSEYQELVQSMFHAVDGTDLDMSVLIASEENLYDFSLSAENKDVNIKFLKSCKEKGEYVESGTDAFVLNLDHISVLVKGLPVEDEIRFKQLKEFVFIVVMAANLRVDSLKKEVDLETLRRNIYKIFKKTHVSFEAVQDNIDNQIIQVSNIFLGFEKNLKESLLKMSLSESYMKMLTLLLHDTKTELNLLLTSGLTIDESFLKTIIKLEEAYSNKYSNDLNE